MDLIPSDFSAKQLREWLRRLGKPAWGTKATLIMRLNELSLEERGDCPIIEDECDNTVDEHEEEQNVVDEGDSVSHSEDPQGEVEGEVQLELETIRKELEMVRRECKLLSRENALLKQQKAEKRTTSNSVQEHNTPMAMISFLKEVMMEFNGEVNVDIWISQFKNMGETYKADTNTLRALFVSKMKGRAQQWLQQVPNYASKHPDELLKELQTFFCDKTNKLKLRKTFENRKWSHKETFMQYGNEKILLANSFNIPEEELVEYIIDGIPDPQLRTHASLMCITTTAMLMRAFANIELKTPNHISMTTTATVRCYNCDSNGHYASDCRKPKREPGTCYVCGSKNHIAVNCQQRKMPVMTVEEREYNEYNA